MNFVTDIELIAGSNEERLPGFDPDFPCITSYAMLDRYPQPFLPWHWHRAIELFYIQSGILQYSTPSGSVTLYEGCGGLINSGVLHMTSHHRSAISNIQLVHLFDPSFLAGTPGSRIEKKYIDPLVTSPGIELIALFPDQPEHASLLSRILESFSMTPDTPGYELLLREKLSGIWFQFLKLAKHRINQPSPIGQPSDRVKQMMVYIHEHYAEPLQIRHLAKAGLCSERECHRIFRICLHTTPCAYLHGYRLRQACRMLLETNETLTAIAHSCGFSSSSYLGKVFRSEFGCTPMAYRKKHRSCTGSAPLSGENNG